MFSIANTLANETLSRSAFQLPNRRVLVVDDERDLGAFLCDELSFLGFDPLYSSSLSDALHVQRQMEIGYIISDVRMPEETGLSLLHRIKSADPVFPRVAIMSAYCDASAAEIYASGAEAFLAKPLDVEMLWGFLRSPSEGWDSSNSSFESFEKKEPSSFLYVKLQAFEQNNCAVAFGRRGCLVRLARGRLAHQERVRVQMESPRATLKVDCRVAWSEEVSEPEGAFQMAGLLFENEPLFLLGGGLSSPWPWRHSLATIPRRILPTQHVTIGLALERSCGSVLRTW
jgi:two-component system, OmpR family, response regulator